MFSFVEKCKNIIYRLFKPCSGKVFTFSNQKCYDTENTNIKLIRERGLNMNYESVLNKVNEIRKKYNLSSVPVDLSSIIESENITVKVTDLSQLERRAGRKISGLITIEKEKENKIILINSCDAETRRKFTLAHELGHYFLHTDNNPNENVIISFRGLNNQREREADWFATALIMPEDKVKEEYNKAFIPSINYLAKIFEVSPTAMSIRLRELGLIGIG